MNVPFDPLCEPTVQQAVEAFCGDTHGLCGVIDRRDEMFRYNRDQLYGNETCAATLYFLQGWQIAATVRDIATVAFGRFDRVDAFLDFASGYGRAARFIARDIAPERMWSSDIVPEAVAFQQQHLGVHGVVSTADPEALRLDRGFDYLFVSSLFSHLPAATFGPWLARLLAGMNPGGLLALSVLDGAAFGGTNEATGGMVFHPESESAVLPGDQYGTAYVTESFVRERIRAVAGDVPVARVPAGLCGHQDLYLIGAPAPAVEAAVDATTGTATETTVPRLRRFPRGELDRLEPVDTHTVDLGGWVQSHHGIGDVALWSNGRSWPATITDRGANPTSRTAWEARLDRRQVGLDDMVLLVATTNAGIEAPFALGTLRPFLAR